jgi:haloalkane dehalogenase
MVKGTTSLPGYPFQGQRLAVRGGHALHYLDEGPRDAPPVLMVHGNPTWSYYFRGLVAALAGTRRVIVPDHIGMGLSDKPRAGEYEFTLARRIEDLEALVASLGLAQPLSLVVHDWGGMIGCGWAVGRPERVARLVVLNTAAFGLPPGTRVPWQLRLARAPLLGALLVQGLNLFCRGAARGCVVRRPLAPEVRAAYLRPYDTWAHRLAVLRFVEDIPLDSRHPSFGTLRGVEDRLEALARIPLLICWGLRDFVFGESFLAEWVRRFPQAEVHRFEEAGHYLLEDAAEEVVALVKRFLGE